VLSWLCNEICDNDLGIYDGGQLINFSSGFAQMSIGVTSVEVTTVCPTIANTMLCVRHF